MNGEVRNVKLQMDQSTIFTGELAIFDEMPENPDKVALELKANNRTYLSSHDDFFSALLDLRSQLEKDNIQIMCNGAARNVYPSGMQFSMGNSRKGYKKTLGKQAKSADLVDIFDCDSDFEFVSIDEQLRFNKRWSESIHR